MKRSVRWLVPGGVLALVAAAVVAPGASADLPAKTPQEVLVMAAESDVESFSGTVLAVTDLGIPTALLGGLDPSAGPGGGMPSGGLGDEQRTVRIWRDGDELARASVASTMGETTLIRNGDQLWLYESDTSTLTTGQVPEHDADAKADAPWDGEVPDPAEAAQWLLDAVEPTTTVTAGEPMMVAGRAAYQVVLTPEQDGTLIGSASLAVDAQTGAVLRVQVTATGASEPAIDIGFTSFDPTAPSADVFDLTTPPGATVETFDGEKPDYDAAERPEGVEPAVVGEGWTSVLVMPAPQPAEDGSDPRAMLPADLLTPVAGGDVLRTSLLSVMLADDGRVLVGAVTPQVLEAAADAA
jgi:outer membrane lipoprotein-sorting protein